MDEFLLEGAPRRINFTKGVMRKNRLRSARLVVTNQLSFLLARIVFFLHLLIIISYIFPTGGGDEVRRGVSVSGWSRLALCWVVLDLWSLQPPVSLAQQLPSMTPLRSYSSSDRILFSLLPVLRNSGEADRWHDRTTDGERGIIDYYD